MGNGAETTFLAAKETGERRGRDRRASRRTLDPLFAATLVNQLAPAETEYTPGYAAPRGPRPGIAFDVRA